MAALHELQAEVEAQGTVILSAIALLEGLHEKLSACGTDERALADLKAELADHTKALADAVAKNTIAEIEPNS